MTGCILNDKSKERLGYINHDLASVVEKCAEITEVPFQVSEGLRSIKRQRELVASGASKTMKSRHLTGHAVDLVAYDNGEVTWRMPFYKQLAGYMKQAADKCGVPIEWGGDWVFFKDGPHFQLPWAAYPLPKDQDVRSA